MLRITQQVLTNCAQFLIVLLLCTIATLLEMVRTIVFMPYMIWMLGTLLFLPVKPPNDPGPPTRRAPIPLQTVELSVYFYP
jgi:hypothetical protein